MSSMDERDWRRGGPIRACHWRVASLLKQEWDGGDEGDRTLDLGIANAALSQLSYVPKRAKIIARRAGTRKPNPSLQRGVLI